MFQIFPIKLRRKTASPFSANLALMKLIKIMKQCSTRRGMRGNKVERERRNVRVLSYQRNPTLQHQHSSFSATKGYAKQSDNETYSLTKGKHDAENN